MNNCYFDALPLHPQPEALESFTSYVMRLAEANGISVPYQIQPLFFPDRTRGVIRELADFPMVSFGNLPKLAACLESRLLGTTFYYLVHRFHRPTLPQTTGQFLAGMLAKSLRYCPHCLEAERPYYSLAWRFQTLSGCPLHGCHLLDSCAQCGCEIPFLSNILKVGVCPKCGAALSTGVAEPLTAEEHYQARRCHESLSFLLSVPQEDAPPPVLGPRLAYWRQVRGLAIEEVARQTGMTIRLVRAFEHYRLERGLKLHNYFLYVTCLGLTFPELFATEMAADEECNRRFAPRDEYPSYEEQLLDIVEQAVEELESEGTLLTQEVVSQRVGMSITGLIHYPSVKELFSSLKHKRKQQLAVVKQRREQELAKQVEEAIVALRAQEVIVTQKAISDPVGISVGVLNSHPAVRERLKEATQNSENAYAEKMLGRAERALVELQRAEQPVTKRAVARLAGVTPDALNYHPQVRSLIEPYLTHPPRSLPENVDERLHAAAETLQAQERALTLKSLCNLAGVSWVSLRPYPQAEKLRELCRQDRLYRRQLRRVQVTSQVRQAIADLQRDNETVSQSAVCRSTGLSRSIFICFPELSEQVAAARTLSLQQRRQKQQRILLERIDQAVQALAARNVPLTICAVYRQADIGDETARTYPEVERRAQQYVREHREEQRRQRRKARERELVEQIERVIVQLRTQEKPVTQKAVCQMVGMARPALRQYPGVRAALDKVVQERVKGDS